MNVSNIDELKKFVTKIKNNNEGYKDPFAFGIGRVQKGLNGKSLSANYAVLNFKENYLIATILIWAIQKSDLNIDFTKSENIVSINSAVVSYALDILKFLIDDAKGKEHKNLQNLLILDEILNDEMDEESHFVVTFIFEDNKPLSVESIYLKLYLLSNNKAKIRSLNLDGIFAILPNLAWDIDGKPYELSYLRENEIWLKMKGWYPNIVSVDKFPRYLSHIIPADNTRILDSSKVRMGASLASGTTVMPGASYINFNSGTEGSTMVEGRISSSVIVGANSDIGGGASILGVLSGTNANPISIGQRCLLGANSVVGIPLGDDCIVDAGIAILEGTKVFIDDKYKVELSQLNTKFNFEKNVYNGLELANLNGLHYRQVSTNGQIIAKVSKRAIKLNSDLH